MSCKFYLAPLVLLLATFTCVANGVPSQNSTTSSATHLLLEDTQVLNTCLAEFADTIDAVPAANATSSTIYFIPAAMPHWSTTEVLEMLSEDEIKKLSPSQLTALNAAIENFCNRQKLGEKPEHLIPKNLRIKLWPKPPSPDEIPGYESPETVLYIAAPGYSLNHTIALVCIYYYMGHHQATNLYVLSNHSGQWSILMDGFQTTL